MAPSPLMAVSPGTCFDVFNGDADGLCALTQLRLAEPAESQLVTGVKRDVSLLRRVEAGAGDRVTVLDVSLDANRADLLRLLAAGVEVLYVDHHFAGEIPAHPGLDARIDTAPDTCTSLLVNRMLQGRFAAWAVVGAAGDNFGDQARALARASGIADADFPLLERLGICLNYNGYGETVEDLHFAPEDLFRRIVRHPDPRGFVHEARGDFERLSRGYEDDLARAAAVAPEYATGQGAVLVLPCAAWARRVGGVYANDLANRHPERAHAILTAKAGGGFVVSVRAPLARRAGADALCRQFPTGGGRAAAAGINHLEEDRLAGFVDAFGAAF